MVGNGYWSTGIKIRTDGRLWTASIDFFDDGFCQSRSTEGGLRCRYFVANALMAAQLLKTDAETLGISWQNAGGGPTVYCEQDGELDDGDHPELREAANRVAVALGWSPAYRNEEARNDVCTD